jgi:hypothetical protein
MPPQRHDSTSTGSRRKRPRNDCRAGITGTAQPYFPTYKHEGGLDEQHWVLHEYESIAPRSPVRPWGSTASGGGEAHCQCTQTKMKVQNMWLLIFALQTQTTVRAVWPARTCPSLTHRWGIAVLSSVATATNSFIFFQSVTRRKPRHLTAGFIHKAVVPHTYKHTQHMRKYKFRRGYRYEVPDTGTFNRQNNSSPKNIFPGLALPNGSA